MLRHVATPDGVRIACEVSGEGRPVVLVHGAGSARWSFDLVRPHLERSFTMIAIDRRGRGDSTDAEGAAYEVEREYEDVAAVVRDAGPGAMLVGHSYGGLVAAGAAAHLDGLPRLALYEPPMGGVLADVGTVERWAALVEGDDRDRDRMLREFASEVGGNDDEAIAEMERQPLWEARRRIAPTVPRELRAELALRLDRDALASLAAPALLLVGSASPEWATRSTAAYAEALTGAETHVLEGQGHSANMAAPELLAAELRRFLATG